MKRSFFLFLSILFLISCLSSCQTNLKRPVNAGIDYRYQTGSDYPKATTPYYSYILSPLPKWANFRPASRCFVQRDLKLLNFEAIAASFSLSYSELMNFNFIFQAEGERENNVALTDEAYFYHALEKSRQLKDRFRPMAKKVVLVDVDDWSSWEKKPEKRQQLLQQLTVLAQDHQIAFFSACLTSRSIDKIVKAEFVEYRGATWQIFGVEAFVPFNEGARPEAFYQLNLKLWPVPGINYRVLSSKDKALLTQLFAL